MLMRRQLNSNDNIQITNGAIGGLYNFAQAYVNPGDEVLLIEPYYFPYIPIIEGAGGVVITSQLKCKNDHECDNTNDLTLDWRDLENKINRRTKIIWLNNPNNPAGKVIMFLF